jgi:hypothetical protein
VVQTCLVIWGFAFVMSGSNSREGQSKEPCYSLNW